MSLQEDFNSYLEMLAQKPIVGKEKGIQVNIRKERLLTVPDEKIKLAEKERKIERNIDKTAQRLEETEIEEPDNKKTSKNKQSTVILDKRSAYYDREKALEKIKKFSIQKVKSRQMTNQKRVEEELIESVNPKITKKIILPKHIEEPGEVIEEEKVDVEEEEEEEEEPGEVIEEEKVDVEEEEEEEPGEVIEEEKVDVEEEEEQLESSLGNKELRNKIMSSEVKEMLPKEVEAHRIRSSPFYMENRKLYIQKLVPMFSKYKKILDLETKQSSCDEDSNQKGAFSLMIHQQVVRDYLNLYTPYRGLLLYHGLGSGKTCSSIAIAEGMKAKKQIIVMTLASLKSNFREQLKVCGDPIYKLNQYWQFVSSEGDPQLTRRLENILGIRKNDGPTIIEKNKGAWMVNVKLDPNYEELSDSDKKSLQEQIEEMISMKYTHLNYNSPVIGKKLGELSDNYTKNPFDNSVIIIDEVHNLVSRIVNKIKEKKKKSISYLIYEMLMSAQNTKIVLLSGTPIINYPNEIGVLFNILRGYIRTWNFPVTIQPGAEKPSRDQLLDEFKKNKLHVHDYVEYGLEGKSKSGFGTQGITITRNPFGFIDQYKKQPKPKEEKNKSMKINKKPMRKSQKNREESEFTGGGAFEDYSGVKLDESGNISDAKFKESVKSILNANKLQVSGNIQIKNHLALPDTSKEFFNLFVTLGGNQMNNKVTFQKRILGLTSYFRGADESLYPEFVPSDDGEVINIINVPMSDYQFDIYEKIRDEESKREKKNAKAKQLLQLKQQNAEELFKISSTYKIASRLACNFVFPNPPGRPTKPNDEFEGEKAEEEEEEVEGLKIKGRVRKGGEDSDKTKEDEEEDEEEEEEEEEEDLQKEIEEKKEEIEREIDGEIENTDANQQEEKQEEEEKEEENLIKDPDYTGNFKKDIEIAFSILKTNAETFFSPKGLSIYSPKFLKILQNIQSPDHEGLHLIYSQFRTMEGIGIFKMILDANGYAEFKIRKKNQEGDWEIVEEEDEIGKPKYALHTGTESEEEKKIILNIYNSKWSQIPSSILSKLQQSGKENNDMGDVIKLLMITASGAEGINLKSTRYVHLIEPYWHNVRIDQVIGRARRICSHQNLPQELQTVQVFLYISVFSDNQMENIVGKNKITEKKHIQLKRTDVSKLTNQLAEELDVDSKLGKYVRTLEKQPKVITTDQMLFEGALIKEQVNTQILNAVKESAMDCQLFKDEKSVCFNYGKIKSNAFGSFPTLEQDLQQKDVIDTRDISIGLIKIIDPSNKKEYGLNPKTKKLYDISVLKDQGPLVPIGKLVKDPETNKEKVQLFSEER